jgi:hypothetical protein
VVVLLLARRAWRWMRDRWRRGCEPRRDPVTPDEWKPDFYQQW